MNSPRLAASLSALVLAATCALAQNVVPAQYFGMHLSKAQPWPSVSFGTLRLWDTDTRWQQMNPASGVYDFSTLDGYLALAHAHAVFDVVLVLGGTPQWVSSDPSNTVCDYASVAAGSCAPPSDLNSDGTGTDQAWRDFIYQLGAHVTRLDKNYFSPVTSYEMWNEFSRATESWTGTEAQMARMAQDAYCILKGTGTIAATGESCTAQAFHQAAIGLAPQAIVASPSAQASGPDLYALGSYLSSLGSVPTADVIAVHNYTYGDRCCAFAEALITQWNTLRKVLQANASMVPVWSTEGSWGDTAAKEPDPDMQSAYVARAYLLGWSLGFKRMYWYAWGNSWGRLWSQSGIDGCSDEGSGAGCTSQAARAYGEVYSWMVGNSMPAPCTVAGSIYTCRLVAPDGARTLAVWDASTICAGGYCSHSIYIAPAGYSSYLDLYHVRHNLKIRTMWISAKPVLLSGTRSSRASAGRGAEAIPANRISHLPLSTRSINQTNSLHSD